MCVTVRFIVAGRVQGVSYRAATRRQALALGLRGHAVNLDDGRVEVVAIGSAEAVDALQRWLWQGPPAARVTAVLRFPAVADSAGGFRIG